MNTSDVLNKAADLIEERGWTTGNCGMKADRQSPLCLEGALGEAMEVQTLECGGPLGAIFAYSFVHDSAAYRAVSAYLETTEGGLVWKWNDDQTSGAPVIEALRAAAIIAAAQETDVRVVAPEAELTAVSLAEVAGAVTA